MNFRIPLIVVSYFSSENNGLNQNQLSWFGELPYFENVLPGSDPYSSSEVIVSRS